MHCVNAVSKSAKDEAWWKLRFSDSPVMQYDPV